MKNWRGHPHKYQVKETCFFFFFFIFYFFIFYTQFKAGKDRKAPPRLKGTDKSSER